VHQHKDMFLLYVTFVRIYQQSYNWC